MSSNLPVLRSGSVSDYPLIGHLDTGRLNVFVSRTHLLLKCFTGTGDLILTEAQGLLLLIAFVTTAAGGYVLAWRAKRTAFRRLGSLLIVVVAGLLGLFFLAQAIGALTEPRPAGTSRWWLMLAVPVLLAFPTCCFVIAAVFIRRLVRYRTDGERSS